METRFLIKAKKNNDRLIYFSFYNDYEKIIISTGITCQKNEWGKGFLKLVAITKERRNILSGYKKSIDEYITKIVNDRQKMPTRYDLSEYINSLMGRGITKSDKISLLVKQYLKSCDKFAQKTQQTKDIHLKRLVAFFDGKEIQDLSSRLLKSYQLNLDKMDVELTTINDYVKDSKAFFAWCYEQEFAPENYGIYLKKNKLINKQVISLTDAEFKIIEYNDFGSERIQKVIDLFKFGCYTGLRFIDIQRIDKDMINDKNQIEFRIQKTSDIIKIPLIKEAIEILKKYNYQLPKISNQKANKYLREGFKLLDLNRKVMITKEYRGVIKDENKKLYDAISFHKSRKTFITIALGRGMRADIVMRLSGHKSIKIFTKYIDYSESINDEMQKMSRLRVV